MKWLLITLITNCCLSVYGSEYSKFRFRMQLVESSNDWKNTRNVGYIGLFQFDEKTLKSLGYNITFEDFKKKPYIFPKDSQLLAFDKLIMRNYFSLKKYIKKHQNTKFKGTKINKAGILAAAHLGGVNSVVLFFEKGVDKEDSNKTKLSDYMKMFNIYKF